MSYIVRAYDNFHYMDEEEAYELPPFEDVEGALEACRARVDQSLDEVAKPGMTAAAIYAEYMMFGEDPALIATGASPQVHFSAWDYARQRSVEMCAAPSAGSD